MATNNSIDYNGSDTIEKDTIIDNSSYCQVPLKLQMQSNYTYNLQSLKGADFLEVPDAIDLFTLTEGVFQSYEEISEVLFKDYKFLYQRVHCDSVNNYKQKFYVPRINFKELTLVIFNRTWSDSYSFEVNTDHEKKQVTILTKKYYKYPITVTGIWFNLTWLLLPKVDEEFEIKYEQKEIKID